MTQNIPVRTYQAAGGVVYFEDKVLVLKRQAPPEIRLPKGHLEPDESPEETALREVEEEAGISGLILVGNLGTMLVAFDFKGYHVLRTEYYFLFKAGYQDPDLQGEPQFTPLWLPWEEAIHQLTFEGEKEWIKRAWAFLSER